jgi:hypothetical protein
VGDVERVLHVREAHREELARTKRTRLRPQIRQHDGEPLLCGGQDTEGEDARSEVVEGLVPLPGAYERQ